MTIKRRVEITVETQRIFAMRKSTTKSRMWCEDCVTDSMMITPDQAAAACAVSTRNIYRWIEAGDIHFRETERESMLVCLNSLAGLIAGAVI